MGWQHGTAALYHLPWLLVSRLLVHSAASFTWLQAVKALQLPDPLPAQAGADSPHPIEGPLPTGEPSGEPDAEVSSTTLLCIVMGAGGQAPLAHACRIIYTYACLGFVEDEGVDGVDAACIGSYDAEINFPVPELQFGL